MSYSWCNIRALIKFCKHAQIWSKLRPLWSKFGSIQFWIVSPQFAQLNSTHRTSRSQSNHSQEPCEWFGHDLQVLFVKLEQILHLKVDCLDFGPVQNRGSLPYGQKAHNSQLSLQYNVELLHTDKQMKASYQASLVNRYIRCFIGDTFTVSCCLCQQWVMDLSSAYSTPT